MATPHVSESRSRDENTLPPNYAANIKDDLKKEELLLRFSEVLEHYAEAKSEDIERIRLNLLSTRLPDLHLNRCFVAPSSIPDAGLGVFANRLIHVGELITLFPGDALLLWNKQVGDTRSGIRVMFGKHIEDCNADRVCSTKARLYELKISNNESIVADASLASEPAYIGHLINDGCTLMSRSNTARTRYSQDTSDCHNVAFLDAKGCHYMVIATKDIQKGDEMFVSYGEGYWMSRIEDDKSTNQKKKIKGRGFSRRT
ncbi:MAG: hypothetical protein SGBAC_008702 [Bacillariaceae sp.]